MLKNYRFLIHITVTFLLLFFAEYSFANIESQKLCPSTVRYLKTNLVGSQAIDGRLILELQDSITTELSLIPETEISKVFQKSLFDLKIPTHSFQENCYDRAHLLSQKLEDLKIITGKVFLSGDLEMPDKNSATGSYNWGHHVATLVAVQKEECIDLELLDLAASQTESVPLRDWISLWTRHIGWRVDRIEFSNRFKYRLESSNQLTSWLMEDTQDTKEYLEYLSSVGIQNREIAL